MARPQQPVEMGDPPCIRTLKQAAPNWWQRLAKPRRPAIACPPQLIIPCVW
ncbi:MAG: hypothetical protein AB7G75_10155 [Candidatus Binatia bacterium]